MSVPKTQRRSKDTYTLTPEDEAIKNIRGENEYITELKNGITPDVVDTADIVSEILGLVVKYPNASTTVGNELTPAVTKQEPIVDWTCDKSAYYTLSMTDPDAPSREDPKYREWQHWLVVNIPGNDVTKGEYLTEYVPPGPPKGTGPHRYIFLVFEQPGGRIDFSEPHKGVDNMVARKSFNTRKFLKKYNLGKVIAGNYFRAQTK